MQSVKSGALTFLFRGLGARRRRWRENRGRGRRRRRSISSIDLSLFPFLLSSFSPRSTTRTTGQNKRKRTVDARRRVVLDPQVDVLGDAESKVAGRRKVAAQQLVLLHLEAGLDQRHRLLAADRHGSGDLLIAPDREGADRVARLAEDGLLARQLLEDLGGLLEPVSGLSHADVEDELGDADAAHRVRGLVGGLLVSEKEEKQRETRGECQKKQSDRAVAIGNQSASRGAMRTLAAPAAETRPKRQFWDREGASLVSESEAGSLEKGQERGRKRRQAIMTSERGDHRRRRQRRPAAADATVDVASTRSLSLPSLLLSSLFTHPIRIRSVPRRP